MHDYVHIAPGIPKTLKFGRNMKCLKDTRTASGNCDIIHKESYDLKGAKLQKYPESLIDSNGTAQ